MKSHYQAKFNLMDFKMDRRKGQWMDEGDKARPDTLMEGTDVKWEPDMRDLIGINRLANSQNSQDFRNYKYQDFS